MAMPPFSIDKHMSSGGACSPPAWFWLAGAHSESSDSVGPRGTRAGRRVAMKRYRQCIHRARRFWRVLSGASLSQSVILSGGPVGFPSDLSLARTQLIPLPSLFAVLSDQ